MTFGRATLTIVAALAGLLACAPAHAQGLGFDLGGYYEAPTAPDADTPPEMIAKIWYRLAGKAPDFNAWAAHTDEYKQADMLMKETVMETQSAALAEGFSLLVPGDQVTMHFDAQLSEYSFDGGGFVVENITPTTFLKTAYAGEKYAVVPQGFYEMQWIAVDPKAAVKIDTLRVQSSTGKNVSMALFLAPKYAAPNPVTLPDGTYNVLSADILILGIYDENGEALWRKSYGTPGDEEGKRDDLLNLYQ